MEEYIWPDWTDPQLPLPSGKMPRCRYATPIRVALNGEYFFAPCGAAEREKVRRVAKKFERQARCKKVDDSSMRVTVVDGYPVPWDGPQLPYLLGGIDL